MRFRRWLSSISSTRAYLSVALAVGLCLSCGAPTPLPMSSPVPPPHARTLPTMTPIPTPMLTPLPVPTITPLPVPTIIPIPTPVGATVLAPRPDTLGGTITLAARTAVPSLDVHKEFSPVLAAFGPGIVYSRLLRFRSGPNIRLPSLAVECDLCTSWEMPSPTVMRFELRQGAKWHNIPPVYGRTVTVKDVEESYTRQLTSGWPNGDLLREIAELRSFGNTLEVVLKGPNADFPLALADGHSKVLPEELLQLGDLTEGPVVGSGPWILERGMPGGDFQFRRNPDYYETGQPYLDGLRILLIPDETTRVAAFRTKLIDVDQISPQSWKQFRVSSPDAHYLLYRQPGVGVELALKAAHPPFDDVRIRQALFLAVDPWTLNDEVWAELATVGSGVPPKGPGWVLPEMMFRDYVAQPTRSRELLRQAGVTSPQVSLTVADFGDAYLEYGQGLSEQLRSVGFDVSMEILNPTVYGERIWYEGDYAAYLGPRLPLTTPNAFLLGAVHSRGRWNTTGYLDKSMDTLIEAQAVESDSVLRKKIALDLQSQLLERGVRFMPAASVQAWAWWPHVRGLHPNFANLEYAFWAQVWVK